MLSGMVSDKLGFYRTPKLAQAPAVIRALADAREEGLFLIAFWLGSVLVTQRYDAYQLDVHVWVAVLLVQSIPYLASVVVSLISAWQKLPASLVGAMPAMSGLVEGNNGDAEVRPILLKASAGASLPRGSTS